MAIILHKIHKLTQEHQKTKFWTISLRQLKWNAETWLSKARNLSTIALGSFTWTTGLRKYPCTSWHSLAPLECGLRLRPGLPQESLSRERPGPQHPTWAGDQIHSAVEAWQDCWCTPDRSWNVESLWHHRWRGPADPWPNREYHPLREIRTEWDENIIGYHLARHMSKPQLLYRVMKVTEKQTNNPPLPYPPTHSLPPTPTPARVVCS